MTLHKEGKIIVPLTFLLVGSVCLLTHWYLRNSQYFWVFYCILGLGLGFFGLIVNFFRSPSIDIQIDKNLILAPCDGKVVVIEKTVDNVYFKGEVLQISVFMSPLNVHINRSPVGGKVCFFNYFPGKYLVAWHPKSSTENEQTFTVVDKGDRKVGFKQIAGALARRIKYYIKEGDRLEQGSEFGFIKFGSRMDVLIPGDCEILVNLGQKTTGGKTILAKFK